MLGEWLMDKRYASRKFLLACVGWVSGVVFFAFGMLTADQWLNQSALIVGLYMAGNVGDTAVSK